MLPRAENIILPYLTLIKSLGLNSLCSLNTESPQSIPFLIILLHGY